MPAAQAGKRTGRMVPRTRGARTRDRAIDPGAWIRRPLDPLGLNAPVLPRALNAPALSPCATAVWRAQSGGLPLKRSRTVPPMLPTASPSNLEPVSLRGPLKVLLWCVAFLALGLSVAMLMALLIFSRYTAPIAAPKPTATAVERTAIVGLQTCIDAKPRIWLSLSVV